jgi:hypothetical protein
LPKATHKHQLELQAADCNHPKPAETPTALPRNKKKRGGLEKSVGRDGKGPRKQPRGDEKGTASFQATPGWRHT